MTDEDGDLSSILFALLERKVGQKGAFSHGGKVSGAAAGTISVRVSLGKREGGEGPLGSRLDVPTPLRDSSDFFVDRRTEPRCGEEGVNLVLITTLRCEGTTPRAHSVSECLVGSVTRDLGREGRPSREGADVAMDGRERAHTVAPSVELFSTMFLFPH